MRPILLLEINEVPWRILDHFGADSRFPHLKKFVSGAATYTNRAVDTGELSPWVTWPSFHRGMNNEAHHIVNLGQDPSTFQGSPIWEEYLREGKSVGICGSLQSWPPIPPGKNGFYIPDTFAHDSQCVPTWVEPFQEFNLQQTGSNGRIVTRSSLFSKQTFKLLMSFPCLGIGFSTVFKIIRQLFGEFFDRKLSARRPIFQTILMWEIFKKVYHPRNPPEFSTFFTNHVAGIMHRYWDHVFPEDFADKKINSTNFLPAMEFAIQVLDDVLRDAMQFTKANPEIILVFASSMGQQAVHREAQSGFELKVANLEKLMSIFQIPDNKYRTLLAMAPQLAVEIEDSAIRKKTIQSLEKIMTFSGKKLFQVQEISKSLSITLINPNGIDISNGKFRYLGSDFSWENGGIEIKPVDPGTGYHIPEGAMLVYGKNIQSDSKRTILPADQAKKFLLQLAKEGAIPCS